MRDANLLVVDLGPMPYGRALELQREVARARIEHRLAEDVLLLVEHPPVVTLGRGARGAHLLASREMLAARGVELFEVERGGDVTFHGPGQLVGYPILDLKGHRPDLHWYLRQVEESLIRGLTACGLSCTRNPGFTGVWTAGVRPHPSTDVLGSPAGAGVPLQGVEGEAAAGQRLRKIASIGVHVRDWVTWHGFAVNVTTDLSYFELIVPCGISDVSMTSVQRELGDRPVDGPHVTDLIVSSFADVFGRGIDRRDIAWIEAAIGSAAAPREPAIATDA